MQMLLLIIHCLSVIQCSKAVWFVSGSVQLSLVLIVVLSWILVCLGFDFGESFFLIREMELTMENSSILITKINQ